MQIHVLHTRLGIRELSFGSETLTYTCRRLQTSESPSVLILLHTLIIDNDILGMFQYTRVELMTRCHKILGIIFSCIVESFL